MVILEATSAAIDADQFLHGDCAAFAIAAVRALIAAGHDHVGISVLIDEDGEPNTADGRCACHAYASTSEFDMDAAGVRTASQMSEDFEVHWVDTDGPFSEDEFLKGFCSDGGLEVDPGMIDLANALITTRADLVGAVQRA